MSRASSQPPAGNGNGTALAERQDTFPALLQRAHDEIVKLFASEDMAKRFARVAMTEFRANGNINGMSAPSIMASVMQAAQLNLEVGGPMRQAYLVPFKGRCTLQVGYIGYLELARRSGEFRSIDAVLVRENDVFEFERNPFPRVYHKPELFNPGEIVGVYAFAEMTNGALKFEFMNRAEIEKVRSVSPNKDGSVWINWYGEMSKAKVLKRFLKKEALSPMLADALALEDGDRVIDGEVISQAPAMPQGSRTAALGAKLRPQAAIEPPVEPEPPQSDAEARAEFGGGADDK